MEREKRPKLPNFSNAEVAKLIEQVSLERTILMSSFHDSLTIRRKQEIWQRITNAVNTVGGHERQDKHIRIKWRDLKNAVMNKPVPGDPNGDSNSQCQIQEIPYEDVIRSIIEESANVRNEMGMLEDSALGSGQGFPDGGVIEEVLPVEFQVPSLQDGNTTNTTSNATITTNTTSGSSSSTTNTTTTILHSNSVMGTKAAKKAFVYRKRKPARRAHFPSFGSGSSTFSGSNLPTGMDSDFVWLQYMQSEISKNAVKQQLMTEQLEVARLQKRELLLKIKGLEQLQGKNFSGHFDSQSEQSDG